MMINSREFILHRYWLVADRMREDFRYDLLTHGVGPDRWTRVQRTQTYMSLWYMTLYVVVEAWIELEMQDPEIDELIRSPNLNLLRRHRNFVAHFQKEYLSDKEAGILEEVSAQDWIDRIHQAIGRYLLDWLRSSVPFDLPSIAAGTTEEEADAVLKAWAVERFGEGFPWQIENPSDH